MDKETRSRIQRATQAARALLEREYGEQLDGVYDIRPDGTMAAEPGSHLDAEQRVVRTKLVAAVEHGHAAGVKPAEAVAQYLREVAFTTLNRFVALKMLEARGLVQECASRGDQSAGFKEFYGLAPGLVQLPDHGYRLYIESLFDEIGREVRVLFDRRDPASLLWPRRQTLNDLLAILNAAELAPLWGEDETIGWVYQYFNSDEERRQMRAESQAPRNSRELAVRNQFFTPRYVVQFLTDNTLGRIWYEMRHGDTRLRDLDYLVRRPSEVFLAEGEEPSTQDETADENLSQEELLKNTVDVPFRAKKDPRDLKILDPACGSGHFLLYAFDLMLVIYEEAWADEAAPKSEVSGRTLREDHANLDSLRAAAPGLVLRHNLHGIDIDPRCAQIAALALWMRAQRAFKDQGLTREARPRIQKTNIVVAEPMPGEPELRREFMATLDPKLGKLVERVFERMELAGEAGALLRIEGDIRDAVREIYGAYGELFRVIDQKRWQQAESNVFQALQDYAERASNGLGFRRRLFAEDAAHGFGLVGICIQRFDAVLMNPPYGDLPARINSYARSEYPTSWKDFSAAIVDRGITMLQPSGLLGVLSTATFLSSKQLRDFRTAARPRLLVNHGLGVLDGATVETASWIHARMANNVSNTCTFIELAGESSETVSSALRSIVGISNAGHRHDPRIVTHRLDAFKAIPNEPLAYYLRPELLQLWTDAKYVEPEAFEVAAGITTFDNERFLRLRQEVCERQIPERYRYIAKGGEYSPFLKDEELLVDWLHDGKRSTNPILLT